MNARKAIQIASYAVFSVLFLCAILPLNVIAQEMQIPDNAPPGDQIGINTAKKQGDILNPDQEPVEYDTEKAIIFAKRGFGGTNLFAHDEEIEEPVQLTDDELIQSMPLLSPNKQFIAFLALNTRDDEQERGMSIRVMKADSTKQRVVYQADVGASIIGLSWSPDSNKLAFSIKRNDPVKAEEAKAYYQAHNERVAELRQEYIREHGTDKGFKAPTIDLRGLWQPPQMYTISAHARTEKARALGPGVSPSFLNRSTLLYTHITPADDPKAKRMDYQLAKLTVGKSKPMLIGPVNTTMGVVNPDGNLIAFIKVFAGKRAQLWVMKTDGSDPKQLVNSSGNVASPVWHDDGDLLIVTREGRGRKKTAPSIWTISPEGGKPEFVTEGSIGAISGHFYITNKVAPEPKEGEEGEKKQ